MYCTNCGAQVNPGEKFCIRCGAPIDPSAVNFAANQAAMSDGAYPVPQGEVMQGFTPPPAQVQVPQRKKKIWPIVAGIIAALLVVSVGTGFAIKAVIDRFVSRSNDAVEEEIEEYLGDLTDGDVDFDFDYDFDYDYDFGNFEDFEDAFPEDFDVDEFMEEYGGYWNDHADDFDQNEYGADGYVTYDYEYAQATYYDDCIYLEGRDVIDDSSVLYGDKTMGDFCDYIDREILAKGSHIDRDLLYDLLELHMVDGSLIRDNAPYFHETMMYCLTFANEFSSLDAEVDSCLYYLEDPTIYYYSVEVDDREDNWIVDYSNKLVYMNDGDTQYNPKGNYSMFSDKTLGLWKTAIDNFFGT